MQLTKQELVTLQNLLFTGNFGLNMQQAEQVIKPLINKLAQMTRDLEQINVQPIPETKAEN